MSVLSSESSSSLSANGRLRVLLTNDDGPPGPDSPYIFGFANRLVKEFGKAYHITEIVRGCYFYPTHPDGAGETSSSSRQLKVEEGESLEWVLLDGTPATCANIGLHNLFKGEIDLVISGPNLGRNSSAAFALSSGTIGAALSGALSNVRAIAVSYGTVKRPVPLDLHEHAHALSCRIIGCLLASWPQASSDSAGSTPELYNINIPMVDELLPERGGIRVVWTHMWRSRYGRLFKAIQDPQTKPTSSSDVSPGGPDASAANDAEPSARPTPSSGEPVNSDSLTFKFSPEFQKTLISPPLESLPVGSDGWALAQNWASVTPLCASFAEPSGSELGDDLKVDSNGIKIFKL